MPQFPHLKMEIIKTPCCQAAWNIKSAKEQSFISCFDLVLQTAWSLGARFVYMSVWKWGMTKLWANEGACPREESVPSTPWALPGWASLVSQAVELDRSLLSQMDIACLESPCPCNYSLFVLWLVCSQPSEYESMKKRRWDKCLLSCDTETLLGLGVKAVSGWELCVSETVIAAIGAVVMLGWVEMGQRGEKSSKPSFSTISRSDCFNPRNILRFRDTPRSK